ncbi:hypothetical protein [Chitinimonas koreensis]|uniref:hypothetical protein n=1 Tax=Chitinimonas koreensis TaxID=356302 RepID=UPI0012F98644|nr:hypothetical protein [Chitinimonas koreensis]QNM96696.1 hypothetical protein H9L41_23605 [Chitinimonas koreensis]
MNTASAATRIVNVSAFVDWNAQLILTKIDFEAEPQKAATAAFRQTTRRIARCLAEIDENKRFRVAMRLYHGWHQGYEPTVNRKAAQIVIAQSDFATLSQRPNVIFSPNVEFGDKLIAATNRRLHRKLAIHLPNTVRRRFGTELEEKMVDTALAADLVATAYRDAGEWIVVVTEDDDLVPPVYVAEAALVGSEAKVVLLRKRAQMGMLILEDILRTG